MTIDVHGYEDGASVGLDRVERAQYLALQFDPRQLVFGARRGILELPWQSAGFTTVSRQAPVLRGDPDREGEEPRPQRARPVIASELPMNAQKQLVNLILDIGFLDAEAPQGVPDVVELRFENASEVGLATGCHRRGTKTNHPFGLAAGRRIRHGK
jgi:hypothetical protein